MVSTDTYRARVVAVLYQDGAYPPQFMNVSDAANAIAAPGDKPKAIQAIANTAMDDFSPVKYVRGTNRTAISFRNGPIAQLHDEARDWINMWDENELPPGLQ